METLLCIRELAGSLKVSVKTVRKWVLKRQIPYVKIGKVIRFRPSQIDQWIDSGGMAACVAGDFANDLQSETADFSAGELFTETANEGDYPFFELNKNGKSADITKAAGGGE